MELMDGGDDNGLQCVGGCKRWVPTRDEMGGGGCRTAGTGGNRVGVTWCVGTERERAREREGRK